MAIAVVVIMASHLSCVCVLLLNVSATFALHLALVWSQGTPEQLCLLFGGGLVVHSGFIRACAAGNRVESTKTQTISKCASTPKQRAERGLKDLSRAAESVRILY